MNSKKMRVMIVEDEELLLKAVERKLLKDGRDVIPCSSAEEALTTLRSLHNLPDVIWLDYYLKEMNGMQFMMSLKENPVWAQIPVVVVSNSASSEKVKKMLDLGVKKFCLKAESRLEDLLGILDEVKAGEQKVEGKKELK